ncbi:hypothetical protein FM104_06140 [Microbacterium esteraromaticum]|uniref:Uncharacterized protein n=1 Tax=Microbacterium esteraromaticum TaxID=57043 RepID=A0A1R4J978_9MICO|nr:hypothetical protein FM104_06140 [Microbacterium esteraromaticum]
MILRLCAACPMSFRRATLDHERSFRGQFRGVSDPTSPGHKLEGC